MLSGRFTNRPRALIGALGALGLAALALGVILGTGTGSSRGASPAAKSSGATTVRRRNLVATDTESGTLGYANPQTVYDRMSGTITWLPVVGQLIKPGHALYYVDNKPVTLFDGTTPAYRTLSSGVSDGPDVKELNRDLVDMGFDPSHAITVDNTWQTATTGAVDRWQASLGESQTGSITLGQVVFLPGDQRVTTVESVLGSTGSSSGGSGSGTGSGSASSSTSNTAGTATVRPEFASLTTTTSTPTSNSPGACKRKSHKSKCSPSSEAALLALLRAETAELQKAQASGGRASSGAAPRASAGGGSASRGGASAPATASSGAGGGSTAGSGAAATAGSGAAATAGSGAAASAQPILQTTSNRLDVTVDLDATKQSEAVVGEPVTVQMPSGSVVNGKITKVSPIAQSSSSSSGSGSSSSGSSGSSSSTPSATIPVTIELHGRLPASGLDQAAVSVNFEQQKANNALSVPVTALLATAGGGYAVQEAAQPRRLIPVTPGLFAAGYVQISGSQIHDGLQVTNSQG